MNDSGYESNSEIIQHRASGYHLGQSGPENSDYYEVTLRFSLGASTRPPRLRWEQGLFGEKLLSAASLKKMTTPFKEITPVDLLYQILTGPVPLIMGRWYSQAGVQHIPRSLKILVLC